MSDGFSIDLGPDEEENLATQIDAAIRFLDEHSPALKALPKLDELRFDFGYTPRKSPDGYTFLVQCDFFPPAFLKQCAELPIGIELSLYLPPQEMEEEREEDRA